MHTCYGTFLLGLHWNLNQRIRLTEYRSSRRRDPELRSTPQAHCSREREVVVRFWNLPDYQVQGVKLFELRPVRLRASNRWLNQRAPLPLSPPGGVLQRW